MAFQDLADGADAASVRASRASEDAGSNEDASRPLCLGGPDAGAFVVPGTHDHARAYFGAERGAHGRAEPCAERHARAEPCAECHARAKPCAYRRVDDDHDADAHASADLAEKLEANAGTSAGAGDVRACSSAYGAHDRPDAGAFLDASAQPGAHVRGERRSDEQPCSDSDAGSERCADNVNNDD